MDSQGYAGRGNQILGTEIKKDMNYTVSLMENCCNGPKARCRRTPLKPKLINVTDIIDGVMHLQHLQAESKKIVPGEKAGRPRVCLGRQRYDQPGRAQPGIQCDQVYPFRR